MTREEAKQFLPIIQAYAEGKTIECKDGSGGWRIPTHPKFWDTPSRYRIQPELRYVPFTCEDAELFIGKPIVEKRYKGTIGLVTQIYTTSFTISLYEESFEYDWGFRNLEFLDGSPFGKLVNE